MIRSCLLSRKELVDLIKKSPRTKDGYYFFPRFKILMQTEGKIRDSGYYYDRYLFKDKICFDETDIKLFLSKKKIKVDFDLRKLVDDKVNQILEGLEYLELHDKIPGNDYTLEELIDSCIYITYYKNK